MEDLAGTLGFAFVADATFSLQLGCDLFHSLGQSVGGIERGVHVQRCIRIKSRVTDILVCRTCE